MFLALPVEQPHSKVHVLHRVVAKLIDMGLVMVAVALLPYPLGPFLGFVYSLLGEVIPHPQWRGQSVGKKLLHLQVKCMVHGQKFTWRESILRNAPVGFVTFFALIPVWGWLILGFVGVPMMFLEVYLMVRSDSGQRMGDVMGGTEVVQLEPWSDSR